MVSNNKTNISSIYKEIGKNRRITDKVKDFLVKQCKDLEKDLKIHLNKKPRKHRHKGK